jgi:hypothetical protein
MNTGRQLGSCVLVTLFLLQKVSSVSENRWDTNLNHVPQITRNLGAGGCNSLSQLKAKPRRPEMPEPSPIRRYHM